MPGTGQRKGIPYEWQKERKEINLLLNDRLSICSTLPRLFPQTVCGGIEREIDRTSEEKPQKL